MGNFKINQKDLFFILKDQLGYGRLCELARYRDLNEKALDLLVTEAIHFAKGVVAPLSQVGEARPPRLEQGTVVCATVLREAFRRYGQDGWTAVARDPEYGGQGFPHMMRIVVNDLMYGAYQSFNMAPSLTHGAAHLIESFGSDELKALFIPRMFDGTWSGTMCLTEPNAGSNLAALETTACPDGGHYKIQGSKIFISWGDHDIADNIIHLVLARIKGAPDGVKGISLFVVPKIRVGQDGGLGVANDVVCTGIEEKLGLHGSPTAALSFGGKNACIGYLCGEPNQGLAHMFQMMNSARINTGVSGMTMASCAYQNALAYTRERHQGTDLTRQRQGNIPIIDHPDVRRMLLWMKATVDGMRSMIYTGAFWSDLAHELPDGRRKSHYENLVDFMTPIIKAYCSDMGFRVCEVAMQCLGGYGYCRDYPIEQYLRDAKIMSLYEGTNGIQSVDLMGRKMTIRNGGCLAAYRREVEEFCGRHGQDEELGRRVATLSHVAGQLFDVAEEMLERRASDPLLWAAGTYPALVAFGEVTMAWRLLDLALIARPLAARKGRKYDFHRGKVHQARYFVDTTLPHTLATIETCRQPGRDVVDMPSTAF